MSDSTSYILSYVIYLLYEYFPIVHDDQLAKYARTWYDYLQLKTGETEHCQP